MSDTIDRLGGFRGAAQTPDRRPSLNTQAAIAEYDYRFAAWEVIGGGDIKAVCRRLDVPGGPSVLGPKVAALRARLDACAQMGRTPPERPEKPPARVVTHMTADEAIAVALGPNDKPRIGLAFDATENPSASQMKGRALVTLSAAPSYEAPAAVPADAPWREALTIKVSAAAVKAVAEQEGKDSVKALLAAGFAREADALRAELDASLINSASTTTPPPLRAPPIEHPGVAFVGRPISDSMWMGSLGPMPYPTFSIVAGLADDIPEIPTAAELAAQEAAAEALWEQKHSEETVLAAQAEHARQRELLHQLGEEEREEEAQTALFVLGSHEQHALLSPETVRRHMGYPEPSPQPTALPVARGRSTKTLAASAKTEVVKAPLRGRSAPAPVAQPTASAAPVKPLPLPTWPEKVKTEPSDPPPKRDRSRNRKVAPKPPEPAQPVLLGMSPETTTPTTVRRPHRRKVAGMPVPLVATKVKQTSRKPRANIDKLMAGLALSPDLRVEVRRALEMLTSSRVGIPGSRQYPLRSLAADEARWEARMMMKTSRDGQPWSESHESDVDLKLRAIRLARATAVDLDTRLDQVRLNRAMALQCPPFKHINEADWSRCITELIMGTTSYTMIARTHKVNHNDLGGHLRRHGVRRELFAELASRRGMRASQKRRSLDDTCPLALLFGRKLHQVRSQYALTQTEVAVALDLPPTIVTAMEQGRYAPCSVIVKRAATYFRMDWRDLLHTDSEAELLRMLVDGTERKQRAWTCADLLRHLVLPYLGVVVPEPTRRQVAATAKTKAKAKVNP